MRNFHENLRADQPQLTVIDLEKWRFDDKFGNRSGIKMWVYNADLNLWLAKRNYGTPEYYKDTHDFCSWTKVDITELSKAPFHNPSKDPQAFNFKYFLERQVKEKFTGMKTTNSLVRRDPELLDPRTNKPMKIVLWPPTK